MLMDTCRLQPICFLSVQNALRKLCFFTRKPDDVLLLRHHRVVNATQWGLENGRSLAIFSLQIRIPH